jgi:predicted transcriptional regulator
MSPEDPRTAPALEMATGGRPIRSGEDLMALARALVLVGLADGPSAVALLPRRWPVTSVLLRAALRLLEQEGLIARTLIGTFGRYELTPRGRVTVTTMLARTGTAVA